MRDLIKFYLVGIVILCSAINCFAAQYKAVILPDNIVTEGLAIDSYVYNQTAEFFSNEIINILNQTDSIKCPTVSEERKLLKSNPSYMIPARDITEKFRTTYNIDFPKLKKIANINKTKHVLLLTSSIDAENYVLRRTLWDFLNIPGATVIDPAYKISTYAVLVDTSKDAILWSNTFYKTISVVEGRIIPKGPSPQTEQLQKIRDYSRMLCPEIAENVQVSILTPEEYQKESKKVYYDMGNFDNVFTKKYRRWYKEGKKDYNAAKSNTGEKIDSAKAKVNDIKEKHKAKQQAKMEVRAEKYPCRTEGCEQRINTDKPTKIIQPLDFEDQSLYEPVNVKKRWKNRLLRDDELLEKPELRDYDRL